MKKKDLVIKGRLLFPADNLLLFMGLKDKRNLMREVNEKLDEYTEEINGKKYVSIDNIRMFADEMWASRKFYMYDKENIYWHLLEQIEYWTETGFVEMKYIP